MAGMAILAICWSLKLCLGSMCGAKSSCSLPCVEQSLHCSHPYAEQIFSLCSAHRREQYRLCSAHGMEPCRLCSAHGVETQFQGPTNNFNNHFCQFSKTKFCQTTYIFNVKMTYLTTFKNGRSGRRFCG